MQGQPLMQGQPVMAQAVHSGHKPDVDVTKHLGMEYGWPSIKAFTFSYLYH